MNKATGRKGPDLKGLLSLFQENLFVLLFLYLNHVAAKTCTPRAELYLRHLYLRRVQCFWVFLFVVWMFLS